MPLHKGRTVFVKIRSRRCNGIFYIGAVREFADALKDIRSTMYFYHCLQQELNNFRMKIATHQYLRGGSEELYVIGWDVSVNINHTLWQYQPGEVGENAGESLRHWQSHNANVGRSEEHTSELQSLRQ